MIRSIVRSAAAGIALAATFVWATPASAGATGDEGGTVRWPGRGASESAQSADDSTGGTLLVSGLVTLTLSYIPAFVLATQSTLPIDQRLYAPVVGPWLDLANRPACGPTTVLCNTEIAAQAMLVADGIVQAVGAIQVLVGLGSLANESSSNNVKVVDKVGVRVTPAQFGAGGYGLAAIGKF
jgi:hypothetical protein